uniref:Uncharacterized protein n=1 Tax=Rhizophora mucronata TaxID=61149 RepID=A0A2P2K5R5_RHIMU
MKFYWTSLAPDHLIDCLRAPKHPT